MRKISGLIGCRSGAVRSSLRVLRIPRCRTGMRPRPCLRIIPRRSSSLYAVQRVSLVFATYSSRARWAAFRSDSFFSSAHRAPLIGSLTPLRAVPDLLVSRHAERS